MVCVNLIAVGMSKNRLFRLPSESHLLSVRVITLTEADAEQRHERGRVL